MGTNRQTPLSLVIFGKTRQALLGLFFSHPDKSFYVRQVVRIAAVGHGAVQRELQRLAKAGILTRELRGNQIYYQANRACPVFPEICSLIAKTAGLVEVLHEALAPVEDRLEQAFVYGSLARGEAGDSSDVDLLLVGDADDLAVHRAIRKSEEKLSRSVHYTLLTRREFQRRRKEKGGFLSRVLSAPIIPIFGDAPHV